MESLYLLDLSYVRNEDHDMCYMYTSIGAAQGHRCSQAGLGSGATRARNAIDWYKKAALNGESWACRGLVYALMFAESRPKVDGFLLSVFPMAFYWATKANAKN